MKRRRTSKDNKGRVRISYSPEPDGVHLRLGVTISKARGVLRIITCFGAYELKIADLNKHGHLIYPDRANEVRRQMDRQHTLERERLLDRVWNVIEGQRGLSRKLKD